MADSDDDYERRKGRDKFRRERNDYERRDDRRREGWDERWVWVLMDDGALLDACVFCVAATNEATRICAPR